MANLHDSPIQDTPQGVILTIRVQPKAPRSEYVGLHGDVLKVRIASPPIHGAANEALCRFLSEHCAVPRSHVILQAGHSGRRKRVLMMGLTRQHAVRVFGL